MTKEEIQKIATDVQAEIEKGKATFFVNKDEPIEIPAEEQLYELKADISNKVAMYFVKLSRKARDVKIAASLKRFVP